MTRGAKAYTAFISIIGFGLFGYAVYQYIITVDMQNIVLEIQQMVCLLVLCVCCCSLPIQLSSSRQALEISVISIVATVVAKGPYAAMIIYMISSLFVVKKISGKYQNILNTPIIKTIFNNANLMIAIFVPGVLLFGSHGYSGETMLPNVILPAALFTIMTFFANSVVIMILFVLDKKIKISEASSIIKGILPNVLFAMPLGILMALLFNMKDGHWLTIVMLFPLLLARYAWSLYLES